MSRQFSTVNSRCLLWDSAFHSGCALTRWTKMLLLTWMCTIKYKNASWDVNVKQNDTADWVTLQNKLVDFFFFFYILFLRLKHLMWEWVLSLVAWVLWQERRDWLVALSFPKSNSTCESAKRGEKLKLSKCTSQVRKEIHLKTLQNHRTTGAMWLWENICVEALQAETPRTSDRVQSKHQCSLTWPEQHLSEGHACGENLWH